MRTRSSILALGLHLVLVGMSSLALESARAEKPEENARQPNPQADRSRPTGYRVRISLPIESRTAHDVEQTLRQLAEQARDVVRAEERPVVVLEFDTSGNRNGRGSRFGSCMDLARMLAGPELNRLRTVAYVPPVPAHAALNDVEPGDQRSQLMGHALLVALAANELAVAPQAAIGRATVDEQRVTNLVREVYREIAQQRLTLPVPVVMAMVDPATELYQVATDQGMVFVDGTELQVLEADGRAIETTTLCPAGELAMLTGRDLQQMNLIRSAPPTRAALARRWHLDPAMLEAELGQPHDWQAVQIAFPEYLDRERAGWTLRSMNQHLNRKTANLFFFRFDSTGGDLTKCVQLARRISELDPAQVRTVAWIEGPTRGPAAIVALACDHILIHPTAALGGAFEPRLTEAERNDALATLERVARAKGRDAALLAAVLDPDLEVMRYRQLQTGQVRLMTEAEWKTMDDRDAWALLGPLGMDQGISAQAAERLGIARRIVDDFSRVTSFYHVVAEPVSLQPTPTEQWLKRVAHFLSSPFVTPWLLFGAFFFLSTEMSAPGVSLPGFLGTLCVVLFFWSQYLDGNAEWFEILMFITGIAFVLIEVLVIPGFGIFGIGGLVMIVVSLILASQTFTIPLNAHQLSQLSLSLLPVVGAGAGLITAMFFLRNTLPNIPYLNRMMLPPPQTDVSVLDEGRDPEALVDWRHLEGEIGLTISPLVPAGKARIGADIYDVISDGRMIEKGQRIRVDQVTGNRLLVSPVDDENRQRKR